MINNIHFISIDSTNSYLKRNYKSLKNYTFVSADKQEAGRGRNNREWLSEDGRNLLSSLLISDEKLILNYKAISIIAALSVVEVLEDLKIKNVKIKWPNDVYVNDLKICGILLEAICIEKNECLIVGIGLNVNQENFIGDFVVEPTSIKKELNIEFDIKHIKKRIYRALITNFNSILNGKDLYSLISKHDYLKGKEAYCIIDKQKRKIEIVGINEDYSLKISCNNIQTDIIAGEITFHI